MKLELAEPARRQAVAIEGWWAENRPAAPTLFAQELRDTREYLRSNPGNAKLTSTQVYTRVSIAKLKAVHTATHPVALLEGRPGAQEDEPDEDGERAQEGPMARGSEGY